MAHGPAIAIYGILDEIAFPRGLAGGRTFEEFGTDPMAYRAAAYSIQIISEAVRRIPDEWLAEFPEEPWPAIKRIGNKIRHEYYRLDDAILWTVITGEAPSLQAAMEKMLAAHGEASDGGA